MNLNESIRFLTGVFSHLAFPPAAGRTARIKCHVATSIGRLFVWDSDGCRSRAGIRTDW